MVTSIIGIPDSYYLLEAYIPYGPTNNSGFIPKI
jgi:hypothetical protein